MHLFKSVLSMQIQVSSKERWRPIFTVGPLHFYRWTTTCWCLAMDELEKCEDTKV